MMGSWRCSLLLRRRVWDTLSSFTWKMALWWGGNSTSLSIAPASRQRSPGWRSMDWNAEIQGSGGSIASHADSERSYSSSDTRDRIKVGSLRWLRCCHGTLPKSILDQVNIWQATAITRGFDLLLLWSVPMLYVQCVVSFPMFAVDRVLQAAGRRSEHGLGGRLRPKMFVLHGTEWRWSDVFMP